MERPPGAGCQGDGFFSVWQLPVFKAPMALNLTGFLKCQFHWSKFWMVHF